MIRGGGAAQQGSELRAAIQVPPDHHGVGGVRGYTAAVNRQLRPSNQPAKLR